MARRLTPSERQAREREREERLALRREKTAARREQAREARERQKAQEKRAKEAKTNQEISKNKGIVSEYNRYIESLGSLHTRYNPKDFLKDYEKRLEKRSYYRNPLPQNPPFKEKEFSIPIYQIKPFNKIEYIKNKFIRKGYEESDNDKLIDMGIFTLAVALLGIIVFAFEEDFDTTMILLGGAWGGGFWGAVIYYYTSITTPYLKLKKKSHYKEQDRLKEEHEKKEAEKLDTHNKNEAERKAKHEESEPKKKEILDKEREEKKKVHEAEQKKAKEEWEKKNEKIKADYKIQEDQNKKQFNKEEDERLDILKKAQNGDIEYIEMICESVLPLEHGLYHPKDFVTGHIDEYDVGYDVSDSSSIDIVIQLPDFDEVIPTQKVTISPTGKSVKYSELSNRARNRLIDQFICSLAFEHVICVMRAFPHVSQYNLEAFNLEVDTKTGGDKENIILKVNFDQSTFLGLNLKKIDPVAAIENFDHEFKNSGKKSSQEIKLNASRDQIVWSTPDNKGLEIPYGVHPDETSTRIPR